jgi:hypothetical protein
VHTEPERVADLLIVARAALHVVAGTTPADVETWCSAVVSWAGARPSKGVLRQVARGLQGERPKTLIERALVMEHSPSPRTEAAVRQLAAMAAT